MFDSTLVIFMGITLVAAIINGAIGYGFSSITVPVALLFYTNRILNPALVLVEVMVNAYMLFVNRKTIRTIFGRVSPILIGLVPGVFVGALVLAAIDTEWAKFFTYLVLLPLIILQLAGVRRPIRNEKGIGYPFGTGVGFLYSATTISGPPLALFLNNMGLVKTEFRAAIGIIRLAESGLTASIYALLGLYSRESFALMGMIPSVLIGIPLGHLLVRAIAPEPFRRLCMGLDLILVGFGLSHVVAAIGLMPLPEAYGILLLALMVSGYFLYRFFAKGRSAEWQGISEALR